jgi:hypothetical protein
MQGLADRRGHPKMTDYFVIFRHHASPKMHSNANDEQQRFRQ